MVIWHDELLAREHPLFEGSEADLKRFLELAATRGKTDDRVQALKAWTSFKIAEGLVEGRSGFYKGDWSRTVRAMDLRGANLEGICVGAADLRHTNFDGATLKDAWLKFGRLFRSTFRGADMQNIHVPHGDMAGCDLRDADLRGADLTRVNLSGADLRGANLAGSTLEGAVLVEADLRGATLTGSRVYGISAWDVKLDDDVAKRQDLRITRPDQPEVVVDEIEVAQFTYLLLHNPNIRRVIKTIGDRGVLILGRFTPARKAVLDALRDALRHEGFVPMLFDFERASNRDFSETVVVLAGMSRFVIADLTKPRSIPLELQATLPTFNVPFVPILQTGEEPFAMFRDLWQRYGVAWGGNLLEVRRYTTAERLLDRLRETIIGPAIEVADQMERRKGSEVEFLDL